MDYSGEAKFTMLPKARIVTMQTSSDPLTLLLGCEKSTTKSWQKISPLEAGRDQFLLAFYRPAVKRLTQPHGKAA